MAKFPAMPLWTDAYLADCGHLDDAETGRYLMILIQLWRAPRQRFPNDDAWLARKFRRSVEDVKTQLRPLIIEFCRCTGNSISQDRLSREFAYVSEKSKKQSVRSKVRWDKEKGVSHGNAPTPTPTPTPHKERETSVSPKKATRIPSDWLVSEALREWSIGQGLSQEEITLEAEQFRDHWRAATKNATSPDWPAKWRTWVRNTVKWNKPQRTNRNEKSSRTARLIQMASGQDERAENEPGRVHGDGPDFDPPTGLLSAQCR